MDLRIAIAVMIVTLAPGAGLAQPKGEEEPGLAARGAAPPVRSVRKLALAAHFEVVASRKPVVLLGLRMTGNVWSRLGWHASAVSSEILTKIDAGVRGYLLQHQVSPYVAVSGGVVIGHFSDIDAAPTFSATAGVELATRAGLHVYAEGGLVLLNLPAFMGTAGVGYRF